jgi:hypothetical protein
MKFRVHTKTGGKFRRNGMTFGPEPTTIDTARLGWTDQQVADLKATPALYVEAVAAGPEPGTPDEAVTAAEVAGESLPGAPTHAEARRRGR